MVIHIRALIDQEPLGHFFGKQIDRVLPIGLQIVISRYGILIADVQGEGFSILVFDHGLRLRRVQTV